MKWYSKEMEASSYWAATGYRSKEQLTLIGLVKSKMAKNTPVPGVFGQYLVLMNDSGLLEINQKVAYRNAHPVLMELEIGSKKACLVFR